MVFNLLTKLKSLVYDKDENGITSTDLGSGKRGLDVNATVSVSDVNSKTQDGSGNAITSTVATTKRGLDVNIVNPSSIGSVKIEDANISAQKWRIDSAGYGLVKFAPPVAPPGSILVEVLIRGTVSGSTYSDTPFFIPPNTTFSVQRMMGGCASLSSNLSSIETHYDPSGAVTINSYLMAIGYIVTGNYMEDMNGYYAGDGTKAVILRRYRLDAGAKEIYGRMLGYLSYTTMNKIDTGSNGVATTTTLTSAGKAWATNVHAGRYLIIQRNGVDQTPLKIASNTGTVITLTAGQSNAVIGSNLTYKIVTFS